jgi:hypothetical protein
MDASVLGSEEVPDKLSIKMQSMFMSHSLATECRCFEWSSLDDVSAEILVCLLIGLKTYSSDTRSSEFDLPSSIKRHSMFHLKTVAREIICLVGVSMDVINILKTFLHFDR